MEISRAIRFSPEEERIFRDNGLELDGPFMELLLHWNGTDGFEPSFSDKKCHDLCVEAVVSYADTVSSALKRGAALNHSRRRLYDNK